MKQETQTVSGYRRDLLTVCRIGVIEVPEVAVHIQGYGSADGYWRIYFDVRGAQVIVERSAEDLLNEYEEVLVIPENDWRDVGAELLWEIFDDDLSRKIFERLVLPSAE
jgi:hypothetical protein